MLFSISKQVSKIVTFTLTEQEFESETVRSYTPGSKPLISSVLDVKLLGPVQTYVKLPEPPLTVISITPLLLFTQLLSVVESIVIIGNAFTVTVISANKLSQELPSVWLTQ